MIKQFSAGDITVRPFGTFKRWTIQSMDSGALDEYGYSTYYSDKVEINNGQKIEGIFYPSGSSYYVANNEPINPSGKYYRNIYKLADSMFYKFSDDPLKQFGIQETTQDLVTGNKEIREIHDRIRVAAVAHNVFGESIAPETVRIIDNSNVHQTYKLYDDGYTNLRVSGSHFSDTDVIGAVRDEVATPRWVSGLGQYYVTHTNGTVSEVSAENARYYASMGLTVRYVAPASSSDWTFDQSTATDEFQANNEHFGEAVSAWYKYIAVGSSMDKYNLSTSSLGYVGLYKFDDNRGYHRLVKQFHFPFTQSADGTLFKDTFGYSVAVRDNFLAIGSPTGSVCDGTNYPGFVCVYDKKRGGTDYWGRINLLIGETNGDRFGNAVSIDSDILAVGAPGVSGSVGTVYIYRRKKYMSNGCDTIPTGSDYTDILTIQDFTSVMETSSFVPSNGAVPTYISGNYSWELETKLTSSIAAAGDNFGWCLEVSDDRIIVGTNKTGLGYATLFTCSYSSASLNDCPTASWAETKVFVANSDYADLNMMSGLYNVDVSNTLSADKFGTSVAMSGDAIVIASPADRAFKPYTGYPTTSILGAAYFYNISLDFDCSYYKSFGKASTYQSNNNFAFKVAVDGNVAAVSSLADNLVRTVDFTGSQYVLENYSYQSTGSEDGVLGRVTLYYDSSGTGSWSISGDMKRNKEAGKPYNIYGYDIDVSSDFLVVGGPIVNTASAANYNDIVDQTNLETLMPSSYSGSIYVYDLNKYALNQPVGNVFYKNGFVVLTNTASNFSGILSGTGSAGFEMKFQGSHTIYEHEYLCSVRPGEFNYSTNPSSLISSPMTFDVNQDGVFDYRDVDLIMRFLQRKKFYEDFVFDENGIILEQDTLADYSWWGSDMLLTEGGDLILQETDTAYLASSSLTPFTKAAYDYIQTYLVNTGILDVNGDGQIDLSDGGIVTLYYFTKLNPTTLAPFITTNSTRLYVKDVVEYLDHYCQKNVSKVNPEFLGYQWSSSYDPTGSFLAPFVTTIGLYQDNQLVAVGKLGRPVKNLIDWPINFVVRFDT